jgi:thiol-disulfide isomerase/thioredoxin
VLQPKNNIHIKTANVMHRWSLRLMAFALMALPATAHSEVQFIQQTIPIVKDMAAREGKLFFVHFTAAWCMPCQWMEQHTFADRTVADFSRDHYLAVKMDIDHAVGMESKKAYSVHFLPTILIFDASGTLLERAESSMSAAEFIQLLRRHISTPVISRPTFLPVAVPESTADDKLSRPRLEPEPVKTAMQYTIQAGVFGDYANAVREAARIEQVLNRPVDFTTEQQAGKILYKISIGSFDDKGSAEVMLEYLQSISIRGYIREK